MKNRRDFYKYNLVLALIVFLSILMHIDNSSNQNKHLPDFTPKRHIASLHKAHQSVIVTLTQEKISGTHNYRLRGHIESLDLDGHTMTYNWILSDSQKIISGTQTGEIIAGTEHAIVVVIEDSKAGKVKLEAIGVINSVRIGGSKTVRLSEAPTDQEVASLLAIQKTSFKTKKQIIEEQIYMEPKIKIQQ
jgi:hypothetical protein